MKHLGFTGTRQMPSNSQIVRLAEAFDVAWLGGYRFFHHGDCVGSDAIAHKIANEIGFRVIIHPPTDEKYRAFCEPFYEMRKAKPYIARNHDIVDESEFLIVVPRTSKETLRSGTWTTKRYADKVKGVRKKIILP